MTKEGMMKEIDALSAELVRVDAKECALVEAMGYLRHRINKCQRRKDEIHREVKRLQALVKAQNENNNNQV